MPASGPSSPSSRSAAPHAVADERLIDVLWEDNPPRNPQNALQAQISELRRLLGRDTVTRAGTGYRLALDEDAIDLRRLERLVRAGRDHARAGDPTTASNHFRAALDLHRGPPLAELAHQPFAIEAAARIEALTLTAHEGLLDADLSGGRHTDAIAPLTALVNAHPLHERFHAQLITALYRSGRQSDALRAYQHARTVLAEQMGLDPGPELQALERAVLTHDPNLTPPLTEPASAGSAGG